MEHSNPTSYTNKQGHFLARSGKWDSVSSSLYAAIFQAYLQFCTTTQNIHLATWAHKSGVGRLQKTKKMVGVRCPGFQK